MHKWASIFINLHKNMIFSVPYRETPQKIGCCVYTVHKEFLKNAIFFKFKTDEGFIFMKCFSLQVGSI